MWVYGPYGMTPCNQAGIPYFFLALGSSNNQPNGVSLTRAAIRYCQGKWTRCFGGNLSPGINENGIYGMRGCGFGFNDRWCSMVSTTIWLLSMRDARRGLGKDWPVWGCKRRPSKECLISSFNSSLPPVCEKGVFILNPLAIVPGHNATKISYSYSFFEHRVQENTTYKRIVHLNLHIQPYMLPQPLDQRLLLLNI